MPPTPAPGSAVDRARAALDAGDAAGALVALEGYARGLGLPAATSPAGIDGSVAEPTSMGEAPAEASAPLDDAPTDAPAPPDETPADDPAGLWLLGKALDMAGRPLDAVVAYRAVAERLPILADAIMLAAGHALFDAGRFHEATTDFAAASEAAHGAPSAILAGIGRGNALLSAGRPDDAALAYRAALAYTRPPEGAEDDPDLPAIRYTPVRDDGARAQAMAGLIAAELDGGRDAAAMALRRRLVRELPATVPARGALARLEEASEAVGDVDAAAVLAAAGEHDAAAARLATALTAASGDARAPGDLIVRAMAVDRDRGLPEQAIARADAFLAANADDGAAPTVALRRVEALVELERIDEALAAWAALAKHWPTDGAAAEALWLRARRLDRRGEGLAAAAAYGLLVAQFPSSSYVEAATFRGGFLSWRGERTEEAEAAWQRAAWSTEHGATDRARAAYWLARLAADAGDVDGAVAAWRTAVGAAPFDGYGGRAADRLRALGQDVPPPPIFAIDLADWPEPGAGAAAQAEAAAHPLAERAVAWRTLGDESAARLAIERLRDQWAAGDLARLVAVALLADGHGWPDLASGAARAAMLRRPDVVPLDLARLGYPTRFDTEVAEVVAEHALPTALLRALIWQESRWRADVTSHAGAIGLTQVMPDTGRFIAGKLGEPGFEPAALTRPEVAIRYGAWYLAEQRQAFDGRDAVALAAYNGGPGNARKWWDAAAGDEDAFLELITFDETRGYVRAVLGAEAAYAALYPPDQVTTSLAALVR